MLTAIENAVVAYLCECGLPAVRSYPALPLDESRSILTVGLKAAEVFASGLGSYIGISEENGEVRELYGSKADVKLSIRAFTPLSAETGSLDLIEQVLEAFRVGGGIKLRGVTLTGEYYDSESGMLCCDAVPELTTMLVREMRDGSLGDPSIGGDDA